jgi:hypothetical protein
MMLLMINKDDIDFDRRYEREAKRLRDMARKK